MPTVKKLDFNNKTKSMREAGGKANLPEFDWVSNPGAGRTSDKIIVPSGHPIVKKS